jgi:hypothetical protein
MLERVNPVYLGAAAAVVAALLYVKFKGGAGVGRDIGGLAVDVVDGVITGAVVSTGQLIGLPETNKSECQKRIEEFRAAPWYQQAYLSFGVSANCSAGDYLRFTTTGRGPQD